MSQKHRVPVSDERIMSINDQGAGSVVVLLHGIPGSAASWAEVATRLASHHRVSVPDLIGFGESSRSTDVDQLHARGQAEALRLARAALFSAPSLRMMLRQGVGDPRVAIDSIAAVGDSEQARRPGKAVPWDLQ